jgi:hypothetical protein
MATSSFDTKIVINDPKVADKIIECMQEQERTPTIQRPARKVLILSGEALERKIRQR